MFSIQAQNGGEQTEDKQANNLSKYLISDMKYMKSNEIQISQTREGQEMMIPL